MFELYGKNQSFVNIVWNELGAQLCFNTYFWWVSLDQKYFEAPNKLKFFRDVFKCDSAGDLHIVVQIWDDADNQDGDLQQEGHQEVQEGAV